MTKLELFYPCYPFKINQKFGDNNSCVSDTPAGAPVSLRKVSSKNFLGICPIGYSELYPQLGMKGHTGMDLRAETGQECRYAGPDGTVEEIQTDVHRGLGIGIISDEKYEIQEGSFFLKTRYWHLEHIMCKVGDKIKRGDLIATCDNTGLSSGSHLHFELKPVNKSATNIWYNVFQNNGYFGAIDPLPYFSGIYAKDAKKTIEELKQKISLLQNIVQYLKGIFKK